MKNLLQTIWNFISSPRNKDGILSVTSIITIIFLFLGYLQVKDININLSKIQDIEVEGSALFKGDVTVDSGRKGGMASQELGDDEYKSSYGCISMKIANSYDWVHIRPYMDSDIKWSKGKCK